MEPWKYSRAESNSRSRKLPTWCTRGHNFNYRRRQNVIWRPHSLPLGLSITQQTHTSAHIHTLIMPWPGWAAAAGLIRQWPLFIYITPDAYTRTPLLHSTLDTSLRGKFKVYACACVRVWRGARRHVNLWDTSMAFFVPSKFRLRTRALWSFAVGASAIYILFWSDAR